MNSPTADYEIKLFTDYILIEDNNDARHALGRQPRNKTVYLITINNGGIEMEFYAHSLL